MTYPGVLVRKPAHFSGSAAVIYVRDVLYGQRIAPVWTHLKTRKHSPKVPDYCCSAEHRPIQLYSEERKSLLACPTNLSMFTPCLLQRTRRLNQNVTKPRVSQSLPHVPTPPSLCLHFSPRRAISSRPILRFPPRAFSLWRLRRSGAPSLAHGQRRKASSLARLSGLSQQVRLA